ncbi:glutamate--tRNA ligase [candidate division KSB1 bacterium]|nr:glutamate--tRNA ligase [candidate division KSB1 bacterium]
MKHSARVRFAPSPTGHLHIGNARTAILNWLFARHVGGTFILRIEDTDPERSKSEYVNRIYEDLNWLGIQWDEGPDTEGEFGPYRQSMRFELYQRYANKLREEGKAYNCYCTPEELEQMRKDAVREGRQVTYNRKCLHLSDAEEQELIHAGRKPAVRFKVPEGQVEFEDVVKGTISFDVENIGDFVIMRAEGIPTYNFACVVDDSLMQISHVIRGDDHVSNTPRQILLTQALGMDVPLYAHIPMILGADRMRLSKRHGATSVDEYRAKGYIPEALINFLSLLSWSSQSGDEILSVDRLIKEFDFSRISKSAAVFNVEKLDWMNGQYIREMDVEKLTQLAIPFFDKAGYETTDYEKTKKIVAALQDKIDYLEQIIDQAKIFFQDHITIDETDARAVIRKDTSQKVFWSFLRELRNIDRIDVDIFRNIMKSVQKETGIMGRDLWMPIRVALTGKVHGPELPVVIELFGKDKCQRLVENIVGGYR